jgi:hypothetical protein
VGGSLHITEYQELAREISSLEDMKTMSWSRVNYAAGSQPIYRMEGHAMTALADRFAVIVGGWGNCPRDNDVFLVDAWAMPDVVLNIPTVTRNNPSFRYGFSATTYRNKVYVYGGCSEGGYGGDCNDLYCVEFKFVKGDLDTNDITAEGKSFFHHDRNVPELTIKNNTVSLEKDNSEEVTNVPINYWDNIVASYSDNLALSIRSMSSAGYSRGYHCTTVLHYQKKDYLLALGGLHDHEVIIRLEIYDFETNLWRRGKILLLDA